MCCPDRIETDGFQDGQFPGFRIVQGNGAENSVVVMQAAAPKLDGLPVDPKPVPYIGLNCADAEKNGIAVHGLKFFRKKHLPHMGWHQRVFIIRDLGMLDRMHINITSVCNIDLTSVIAEDCILPNRYIVIHHTEKRFSEHVLRYLQTIIIKQCRCKINCLNDGVPLHSSKILPSRIIYKQRRVRDFLINRH